MEATFPAYSNDVLTLVIAPGLDNKIIVEVVVVQNRADYQNSLVDSAMRIAHSDGLHVMLGFLLTAVAGYIIWSAWPF